MQKASLTYKTSLDQSLHLSRLQNTKSLYQQCRIGKQTLKTLLFRITPKREIHYKANITCEESLQNADTLKPRPK